MARQYYRLSGHDVKVDIPDNHADLLIRRDKLKNEHLAFKTRLAQGTNGNQRIRINTNISKIKSELAIVNAKIANFNIPEPNKKNPRRSTQDPTDPFKRKIQRRQKKLREFGLLPFPEDDDGSNRYEWALSLFNLALGLLNGDNRSELPDDELVAALGNAFSVAINYHKLEDKEKQLAMDMINKAIAK